MAYWRESTNDCVYDMTGSVLRGGASGARYVGTQGELVLSYSAVHGFETLVSYSLFQPGSFIRDNTGPARAIHVVGLEAALRF